MRSVENQITVLLEFLIIISRQSTHRNHYLVNYLVKCNLTKLTTTSLAVKESTSLVVKQFISVVVKWFTIKKA